MVQCPTFVLIMVGPADMKVEGGEEYSVEVLFQPSHLASFSTSLLVNCPLVNQKLTVSVPRIPLT